MSVLRARSTMHGAEGNHFEVVRWHVTVAVGSQAGVLHDADADGPVLGLPSGLPEGPEVSGVVTGEPIVLGDPGALEDERPRSSRRKSE